jgi:WNK lysine deficient protein kinase
VPAPIHRDWRVSDPSTTTPHHHAYTTRQLDHPNIITFYTSWFNKETRRIVFITDLMNNNNNGSLMEFVRPIPVLRWRIVKRWLRQMLEGLAFLHGQSPPIIHRNINCNNIFIIANTGELKIGDLGLSTAAQRPEGCVRLLCLVLSCLV